MKNQKGITLIALIITIIVMLILVGVSVTVALNGGLFETAKKAAGDTETERDRELGLSDGKVEINGKQYDSFDAYVNRNSTEGKLAISPQKATYTLGEEVTIGEEHFYVIKDTTDTVTLLAKYNLKADGTQDKTGAINKCAFSEIENLEFYFSEDLNDNDILKTDTKSAVYKAIQYGESFKTEGVNGRLMTYGEAEQLSQSNNQEVLNALFGNYNNDVYLDFWLATGDVIFVTNVYCGSVMNGSTNYYDAECGVRPVLEVDKSVI